jgi:invasion protein IalB
MGAPEQTNLLRTKNTIMRHSLFSLAVFATLTALPAAAQDNQAPTEGQAPAAGGLSMGEPVSPDGGALGAPYVKAEHGDWDIRCIRTESGEDPCQLYQLLNDEQGNAVAEFTLFPLLPAQGEAVAGGNIISPLETLLPEGVTLAVDGGEARRFPFHFCTEVGCVARIGYAEADIDRFKRGSEAIVGIVPVVAANQRITLKISLSGFTAGWEALLAEAAAAAEAAGASEGSTTSGN